MGPRARSKFGVPMFEPEVFRKQMHCIEEGTCDIVGTLGALRAVIRRPHNDLAPELCRPCLSRYAPVRSQTTCRFLTKMRWAFLLFFVTDRTFFKWTKKLSQLFGHNVLKSRLMNTITTSFDTTVLRDKWPKRLSEKIRSVLRQLKELCNSATPHSVNGDSAAQHEMTTTW